MYYLYIKTHNITRLKYLGFTLQDPYTYIGSGTRWKGHIKKHDNNVDTKVVFESECIGAMSCMGIVLSDIHNIVESDEWANKIPEDCSLGFTSKTSSELQYSRVANGTHPLTSGDVQRKSNRDRLAKGIHPFQDRKKASQRVQEKIRKGEHPWQDRQKAKERALARVDNGTHPFLGGELTRKNNANRLADESHNWLKNKKTVPCYTKDGKYVRIPQKQYFDQTGQKTEWEYSQITSKEGKRRKKLIKGE